MKVVIIKYNAGNVQSLEFALNRLGIKTTLITGPSNLISKKEIKLIKLTKSFGFAGFSYFK